MRPIPVTLQDQDALVSAYGDDIQIIRKYNIPGDGCRVGIQELVDEGRDIIFGTSYEYEEEMKKVKPGKSKDSICGSYR